jgi:hypothetical protein
MVILKHHKNLTTEKWSGFTSGKQLIMIANELNRAKNWIVREDQREVKLCYERALELLCLTIACVKRHSFLRELCRFKEILCGMFVQEAISLQANMSLYKVLLSLSRESYSIIEMSKN